MQWNNQLYKDGMLPFGLQSAPKLFTAVIDAIEWCIHQGVVDLIFHYLDDFLVMRPPNSVTCKCSLELLVSECGKLSVPLASEKIEGPSPILTFLSIEINTREGILCLQADKLQCLISAVTEC